MGACITTDWFYLCDFWNSSFQDRPSSDVERDAEILNLFNFKGELKFSFLNLALS
jgi:hypothetical protein